MLTAQVREKTPQNLDELIVALVCCPGGADIKERMKAIVRDYLANRFGPTLLNSKNPEEIQELFAHCILGGGK